MDDPRWLSADEQEAWQVAAQAMARALAALDGQLQRDCGLSHFEYGILAVLSQAPGRTLQMSLLAGMANGSLSRLSHAAKRLEDRGLVRRAPSAGDGRLTEATLTDAGWEKLAASAPGHVAEVRRLVFDVLTAEQVAQLHAIGLAMLAALDAAGPPAPTLFRRPNHR